MTAAALRLGFAGTPAFAATVLEALLAEGRHPVAVVYTQPDRPAGRGRQPRPSPVKEIALAAGIPVRQPPSARDPAEVAALAALGLDVLVVVAYGLILPQALLDTPRLGCVNVHASLLPRWRGAAPIQRALLAGDARTGVSIMRVTAELDTGPVYLQAPLDIEPGDTSASLEQRLAELGARALRETLAALAEGRARAEPQPAAGVTYAHKLNRAESDIDWRAPAAAIERQVRALQPWPVASTTLLDQPLRVLQCRVETAPPGAVPGQPLQADAEGILVAAGEGAVRLQRVQLPGKRPVLAADLVNAQPALRALRAQARR